MILLDTHVWVWWVNDPNHLLVNLTNEIIVESTQLPGTFHKDPADQLIVATSRVEKVPLLTADGKILDYKHVKTF